MESHLTLEEIIAKLTATIDTLEGLNTQLAKRGDSTADAVNALGILRPLRERCVALNEQMSEHLDSSNQPVDAGTPELSVAPEGLTSEELNKSGATPENLPPVPPPAEPEAEPASAPKPESV